jgi:hypothetical protein
MPVDFAALPARAILLSERRAALSAFVLLFIVVATGAVISIATWPTDRSAQTVWFWTRTFGLPFLGWLMLYSAWRFLGAHSSRDIASYNDAIDRKEARLHDEAAVPFTIQGQSWCFSAIAARNTLEVAMKFCEDDATAQMTGGLVIPQKTFYRGNHADEAQRHAVVLEWLLLQIVGPLASDLKHLRGIATCVCIDSDLTENSVRTAISNAWAILGLNGAEDVQLVNPMKIFAIDGWLDMRVRCSARLVIAVQLRGVISGELQPGQAEAGAAVLLTSAPGKASNSTTMALAHRPSRSGVEGVDQGIEDALRWGGCSEKAIGTVWNTRLAEPISSTLTSLGRPLNEVTTIDLVRTVGDAGVASPWLALALASAKAKQGADAQLILDQLDGDFVAMICRKKV